MSEAARLRAQKAFSTDPDYLERMALAEEAREPRAHRKDDLWPSSSTAIGARDTSMKPSRR